ncbi:MAG: flavodoxin [Clostridia bacterium]|nr:flavodoxin [Clostridia bacterium]
MTTVVIYKSKYGATERYAKWISEELGCEVFEAKNFSAKDFAKYDTVIYGGGLYANNINGISLITKNFDKLEGKKVVVFSTAITPLDCREYYDVLVMDRSFPKEIQDKVKVFNFLGKMLSSELSLVHKAALKTLKKIMSGKENPTDMEKLLLELCDYDKDECDKESIKDLIEYVK